ncbi:amidase [Arthrobacter woluwensis]|uniref:amidase n=1 Tax=Arthrobacter woluwensis TaxID=156980 RepID=UPI00381638ED
MKETPLHWMSAGELADTIARGEVSAREALTSHWERIDRLNPHLNAVIYEDRERAWQEAVRADERQASGAELGPLHGVPFTSKDSNDTAGMPTTWGSPLLKDRVPQNDSLIVARLRGAGAILTGKNNVPEFAAGAHTFNTVFGTTRNPYDLGLSAGGSSGGVASVLAAGIQSFGDGSDMGGSLRIPASFCNVVGLRPSRGRVPGPGADSWAWLGQTGPMAREVSDVALLLSVIAGPDPRVPMSIPESGERFTRPLAEDLSGVRIGWAPGLGLGLPVDPRTLRVLEKALTVFEELGATVTLAAPRLGEADHVFRQTRANDLEAFWGELVRANPSQVKEEVRENVELGRRQSSADLRALAAARTRVEAEVRDYFSSFDLLLAPTAQSLPFPVEERFPQEVAGHGTPDYLDWMRSVCVVTAMDSPAISVPAGFTEQGLPVGLQIVAPHGQDLRVLDAAYAYESRTHWSRHRPSIAVD